MRITLPILLVLAGCVDSASQKQIAASVKLVKVTTWPLSAAEAAVLDDAQRATLAQRGITMRDTTIVFPELPLVGYWVEVGGQRFMADADAVVALSAPSGAMATVYEDFESTTELATFKVGDVAVKPQPARVEVDQVLPSPTDMDPVAVAIMGQSAPESHAQSLPIPYPDGDCAIRDTTSCAPGVNTMGCCVDYDNPNGNGKAYFRDGDLECNAFSVANFFLSTCFNWTAASVCADEKAFGRGTSCWEHHKYRNCQNLSLVDFSATVSESTLIKPGDTLKIKIRNNLPSNDTVIALGTDLDDPGKISDPTGGAGLKGSGRLFIVNHYDDGAMKHVEETEVTYTAPAKSTLPPGCSSVDVTVAVVARTFDPVNDVVGVTVPRFPVFRTESMVFTIDCGNTPPNLHMKFTETQNMHPNLSTSSFNTTAEFDLMPWMVMELEGQVGYKTAQGSITFTYIPFDNPSMTDPCTYSATAPTVMLPDPTQGGGLTIAFSGDDKPLEGNGSARVEVTGTKSCPDMMGGMTTTVTGTFIQNFTFIVFGNPGDVGSLETLAKGPLHGTVDVRGDGQDIIDWTLSKL